MGRLLLLIGAVFVFLGAAVRAEPPPKKTTARTPTRAQLLESANGWNYVNGEWVHRDGYKFVNNKVVRTTAKSGKTFPKPPGKLALENPTLLAAPTKPAADSRSAAEKAAEEKRKNLEPRPASQTGSHL